MTAHASTSRESEHRARWHWFLALGAMLLVLGMTGISAAALLQLTSLLLFGPLLLASSILQLLTAFFSEEKKESFLHFAAAGLEALLGFFIMANPPERIIGLITLIAIILIVIGLARLARSLVTQSHRRAWIFITGVIALLLGISVWVEGPAAKLGFVGLCIAIDFLFHGVSWSVLALVERKSAQAPVSGDHESLT
jgi:uncharacterized membrane protein HdeD (DUF308 family)